MWHTQHKVCVSQSGTNTHTHLLTSHRWPVAALYPVVRVRAGQGGKGHGISMSRPAVCLDPRLWAGRESGENTCRRWSCYFCASKTLLLCFCYIWVLLLFNNTIYYIHSWNIHSCTYSTVYTFTCLLHLALMWLYMSMSEWFVCTACFFTHRTLSFLCEKNLILFNTLYPVHTVWQTSWLWLAVFVLVKCVVLCV